MPFRKPVKSVKASQIRGYSSAAGCTLNSTQEQCSRQLKPTSKTRHLVSLKNRSKHVKTLAYTSQLVSLNDSARQFPLVSRKTPTQGKPKTENSDVYVGMPWMVSSNLPIHVMYVYNRARKPISKRPVFTPVQTVHIHPPVMCQNNTFKTPQRKSTTP